VMTTNTPNLNTLAEKIKVAIDQRESGWVTATLDLCIYMAEARAAFLRDIEFGEWWDAHEFQLNKDDRAAAIAMGQEPDRTRQVLEATTRRSLRLIYAYEFRVLSAEKPPKAAKPKPVSAERARAFAAYDRRKAAGEELTWEAVRLEAGTGHTVVRAVFTIRELEEQIAAEAPPPRPVEPERSKAVEELDAARVAQLASMTAAQRKQFDARVAEYRQQLADTMAAQLSAGIAKWEEETGIALYMKRLEKLETMFTTPRNAIMHKTEYNTILRCLHPDTGHSRTDEERGEAFRTFAHYKLKMVNDEEERERARRELRSSMPKTLTEMLARKKTKTV